MSPPSILLYTGFSARPWSGRSLRAHAEGGSQHATASLAEALARLGYRVVVSGNVDECEHGGVRYLPASKLQDWLSSEPDCFIVVSRYVHFFERYRFRCRKLLFVAHDTNALPWGCFRDMPHREQMARAPELVARHADRIDAVVCQSHWHAADFAARYAAVADRITVIGSALNQRLFARPPPAKVPRRFVYCSAAERGLATLLELWPRIRQRFAEATLDVFSYQGNSRGPSLCRGLAGVVHHGRLPQRVLLPYLQTAEVWFYPTRFRETFCITALEMQYARVLAVCSRLAALEETVGDRGVLIDDPDADDFAERALAALLELLDDRARQQALRERAHSWAAEQTWQARASAFRALFEG